ncbi:MAG: phosphate signaling complex protein PhoU [Planctomycetaceae bacterium]|nr:phosphate signaling complex protein PhoU [Planctomycetaceae bacterium]
MTAHFVHEMDRLHREILSMCSSVEELLNEAVKGLQQPTAELGAELNVRDHEIDELDLRVEEDCLKILALYQPVAQDLRRVTAVLKISAELERVGDLAVSIADRASAIAAHRDFPLPERLGQMASDALSMLHDSIDSYVDMDSEKARGVCRRDDAVDRMNVELLNEVRQTMMKDPQLVDPGMHLFSAIRHIERVADHATNIAEDVVYLIDGQIIRHPRIDRSNIRP